MPLWILVATGLAGAGVVLGRLWRRGGHPADLGAVSHRWLAEQRVESWHETRR